MNLNDSMVDAAGYRACVGIILLSENNRVFWGKRRGQNAWQLPQGGMKEGETAEDAMIRELGEEVGLAQDKIEILGVTPHWLRYRLPQEHIRYHIKPLCYGQKQKWFLLRFMAKDAAINLNASKSPEFDDWCWVDYWYPPEHVVDFKRDVYEEAFKAFASYL